MILSVVVALASITASQAALPRACTEGSTEIVKITSIDAGDGYHAEMNTKDGYLSAYCETGDCEMLFEYGVTNVLAKVTLSTIQMEENIESKVCSITDIELNPL